MISRRSIVASGSAAIHCGLPKAHGALSATAEQPLPWSSTNDIDQFLKISIETSGQGPV